MKLFCNHITEIPNIERINSLTEKKYLRLELPKRVLENNEEAVLIDLQQKLTDYSVFVGNRTNNTVIITIIPVVKLAIINKHIELILNAIHDYIQISNELVTNVTDDLKWRNWELTCDHEPHNRYENNVTKQIVETCNYKMSSFNEIDPYFFGLFIQSSDYPILNSIILDTFHDTARILDVINKNRKKDIFFNQ